MKKRFAYLSFTSATLVKLLTVVLMMMTIISCATTGYQPSSFVLVVEGDEANYPAFEAAAKACGYTAYWRFPGATNPKVTVGPHYNLSRVGSRAARCTRGWVDQHPETGLKMSRE